MTSSNPIRAGGYEFRMPTTVDEWRRHLEQFDTDKEKAKAILDCINGYGFEYGYNQDEDADDLLMAFEAMQPQRFP